MFDCSEFSQEFFEEASTRWKKNKVRVGEAMYRYKKNAFPKEVSVPPVPKLTLKQEKQMEKEMKMRQSIDEHAPPRVRRSARLRATAGSGGV